jgi:hypothetical protein
VLPGQCCDRARCAQAPPGSAHCFIQLRCFPSGRGAQASARAYQGSPQTEGYEAYEAVARAVDLTHAGCFAHARRKFEEARKAQTSPTSADRHAKIALSFIRELYPIERALWDTEQPITADHRVRAEGLRTSRRYCRGTLRSHEAGQPGLIREYFRGLPGFDDKIIALYARGMSTRDIQRHVREIYGIDISPDLVSAVTDSVIDEVTAWQARPLESSYAIVFFDALRVKIRDEGWSRTKLLILRSVFAPPATNRCLDCGSIRPRVPSFGYGVMNEIKARGTQDVLIAVVDGLKVSPEAITKCFLMLWSRRVSCT